MREARINSGYTNREDFASACNVSVRVLSDLESGARSNFSERVLSRLETGLGWPPGTIDQVVFTPDFEPPKAKLGGNLVFRPPLFDRNPVQVEVGAVEQTMNVLYDISRALAASDSKETTDDALSKLAAQAITLCWPYIIRLVEDNCLPDAALHESVTPLYRLFLDLQAEFAPQDTSGNYARWLAGEMPDAPQAVRKRYLERWTHSRRSRQATRVSDAED